MKKRRVFRFIFLSLFLFLCDAYTKYLVATNLPNMYYASPFYPYGGIGVFQNFLGIDFCINYVSNHGGAWGLFAAFPVALLIGRICIILAAFVYAAFVNKQPRRDLPFLLILTGASCNIFDCFVYGAVIDMFHFVLWGYSFPVFNVADMMIFFGVATLLIQSLLEKVKTRERHTQTISKVGFN